MHDIGWSAERIRDELMAEADMYPKGLNPEEYDCRKLDAESYIHNFRDVPLDDDDAAAQEVVRIMKSFQDEPPVELHQDLQRWLEIKRAASQKAFRAEQRHRQDEYLEWIYLKYGNLMNFTKP